MSSAIVRVTALLPFEAAYLQPARTTWADCRLPRPVPSGAVQVVWHM